MEHDNRKNVGLEFLYNEFMTRVYDKKKENYADYWDDLMNKIFDFVLDLYEKRKLWTSVVFIVCSVIVYLI